MSRKHYRELAEQFASTLNAMPDAETRAAVVMTIEAFCRIAKEDNPRFNRSTFLSACGV